MTVFRHQLGTASPRSIGRQAFRSDLKSAGGDTVGVQVPLPPSADGSLQAAEWSGCGRAQEHGCRAVLNRGGTSPGASANGSAAGQGPVPKARHPCRCRNAGRQGTPVGKNRVNLSDSHGAKLDGSLEGSFSFCRRTFPCAGEQPSSCRSIRPSCPSIMEIQCRTRQN